MNDLRRPPRPDASRHRKALPALCLSGGGYRAMLFHVGALRRLNEFGLLGAFDRISSVSGGSIAAATLALAWDDLAFDETTGVAAGFNQVESKLLDFAGTRLDARVIATGLVRPGRQIAEQVAAAYRNHLFGDASLQQLPGSPRFVICASNVGTGSLVRFARPYTADYRVGCRLEPKTPVSTAVAASSAFPPFLSPLKLELGDDEALTDPFPDNAQGDVEDAETLLKEPWTHTMYLSDGGVYDNLGLEPVEAYDTVLVSDGGGPGKLQEKPSRNWFGHVMRSWVNTDQQVRARRRTALLDLRDGRRVVGFWAIDTNIEDYPTDGKLPVDQSWIELLATVKTRLWPPYTEGIGLRTGSSDHLRYRLVNWGYAVCDAAVRSYVLTDQSRPSPPAWPYPEFSLEAPVPSG